MKIFVLSLVIIFFFGLYAAFASSNHVASPNSSSSKPGQGDFAGQSFPTTSTSDNRPNTSPASSSILKPTISKPTSNLTPKPTTPPRSNNLQRGDDFPRERETGD